LKKRSAKARTRAIHGGESNCSRRQREPVVFVSPPPIRPQGAANFRAPNGSGHVELACARPCMMIYLIIPFPNTIRCARVHHGSIQPANPSATNRDSIATAVERWAESARSRAQLSHHGHQPASRMAAHPLFLQLMSCLLVASATPIPPGGLNYWRALSLGCSYMYI